MLLFWFDSFRSLFCFIVNAFSYLTKVNFEALNLISIRNTYRIYLKYQRGIQTGFRILEYSPMLIDVRSPSIEDCGRNIESSYVLHKNDSSSFNGNPHRGGHSDYSRPSTGAAPNVNNYGLIDILEADRHNLRHNHRRSNIRVANSNIKTGCDQFCDINSHTINNFINQ